jgi:phosphoheptose isomerase
MAAITAIGNDLGFNKIFSKQLEFSNADSDDLLVIVSSSGNSPNILNILEFASTIGMESIALIGFDGGRAKDLADIVVHVNSSNYGVVEDCHQIIMHSWAQALRIDEAVSHLKL